jgi:hypothetical protein
MKRHELSDYYADFTPAERVRLVIAASARADVLEVQRLAESCPRVPVETRDPGFASAWAASMLLAYRFAMLWFEAQREVQRTAIMQVIVRYAPDLFTAGDDDGRAATEHEPRAEAAASSPVRGVRARRPPRVEKTDADHAAAVADLKGLYAGFQRFCAALDVRMKDLVALAPSIVPVWEDITASRELLESEGEVNTDFADLVYREFYQLWPDRTALEGPTPAPRRPWPRQRPRKTAKQIRTTSRVPLTIVPSNPPGSGAPSADPIARR